MIYGYARVSTKGQAKDGNSIEDQTRKLTDAGAVEVYTDSFTGTKMERPEFDKLLALLSEGDTLVVTKLDRIARSATKGSELIQQLLAKGVRVHVLNMGLMDNTPTGRLIVNVMFAFAEFERDMIVQRTREGKEIAKQSPDFHEGRPKVQVDPADFQKILEKQKGGFISVKDACEILSISRSTWYNLVKEVAV